MTGVCYVYGLQVLYVLYFHRHSESDVIKAVSVTEFLLAHPCLSLAVFDSEASPVHSRPLDTAQTGLSMTVDGSSSHGLHLSVLKCSFIAQCSSYLSLLLGNRKDICLLTSMSVLHRVSKKSVTTYFLLLGCQI